MLVAVRRSKDLISCVVVVEIVAMLLISVLALLFEFFEVMLVPSIGSFLLYSDPLKLERSYSSIVC